MKDYKNNKLSKRRWPKFVLTLLAVSVILVVGAVVAARKVYMSNLKAVNTASSGNVVVAIRTGSSVDVIARTLKEKKLIRATWAFKRYVASKELSDVLKAGTYRFRFNQDVASIVQTLVDGKVDVELFTIFPTQRLDQVRTEFIDKGFVATDVDKALNPNNYIGHPALVDKPTGASLEGFLYPDSYQRVAETKPETIIKASLDEMAKALTPDIRSNIAKQGISVYQGIIIASIVEQEIPSSPLAPKDDRRKAAQVFLKRIKIGMPLGSDSAALYGGVINGVTDKNQALVYDSPYNTRLHIGFPPGPIGNVTSDGLDAVGSPADTDYLYFVSGDDKVTYFSKTLQEHEALTAQHCKENCN